MKYLSIDIETTGLSKNDCQIIEFGAIIEDTLNIKTYDFIPKFHCYFKFTHFNFEAQAIEMNIDKLKKIHKMKPNRISENVSCGVDANQVNLCYLPSELELFQKDFKAWLEVHYGSTTDINVAGKSVGRFDLDFLKRKGYLDTDMFYRSTTIEVDNYFIDFYNDTNPPNLNKCLNRAGIQKEVSHNALDDAFDVIVLLRTQYGKFTHK
jgi:oligoribonuclease (3'-5' exoribonuclease)